MLSIRTIFPFPLKRHRLSRQTHNDLVFQVVEVISPRHLHVPVVVPSVVQTAESLSHFSLSLYFSKIMRDYYVWLAYEMLDVEIFFLFTFYAVVHIRTSLWS